MILDFRNFNELVGKYSECIEIFRLQEEWKNEKAFQQVVS